MENGYTERLLVTDNTKKAAVFLTFGAQLRHEQPSNWYNDFPSKEAFYEYYKDQKKPPRERKIKPDINIVFNFEPDSVDAKSVIEVFKTKDFQKQSQVAEEKFSKLLIASGIEDNARKELLAAHSFVIAAACREALEQREFLVKECIQAYPERAKVNRVHGQKQGQVAIFGTQASKETIVDLLSKIS